MSTRSSLPGGRISYGPNANCTLDTCPLEASIFHYRPSLAANTTFLVLFFVAMIVHIVRGIRWRELSYTAFMVLGCIAEILGYAARLMIYINPFSFTGFIMQIVLITIAPVFYCAAIYVLLARVVNLLDSSLSRFPPAVWIYGFVSCDVVSLVLQAAGGALSSTSAGSNSAKSSAGVNIALAGLSFQVITLFAFCVASADYAIRWSRGATRVPLTKRFKVFLACLAAGILLIFIRCAYRIAELKDGYSGQLIRDEPTFIALESSMIVAAAFVLIGANPGPAFETQAKHETGKEVVKEISVVGDFSDSDKASEVA